MPTVKKPQPPKKRRPRSRKVTIAVTLDAATFREIAAFVALNGEGETNTHGPLTLETLVAMLLEDVALATRRPGSWEGSHMGCLLGAHGYRLR